MSATTDTLRVGGPCPAGHTHTHTGGHSHADGHGGHAHPHGHGHDHGADHSHDHPQGRGQWRPHTPPGEAPILDIGGDVGALIVYLPELTATGELDVQPVGQPEGRFHTGVHDRSFGAGGDGSAWVAIFPEVVEGRYELLDDHGAPLAQVAVTGGHVQELDLR